VNAIAVFGEFSLNHAFGVDDENRGLSYAVGHIACGLLRVADVKGVDHFRLFV